MKILVISLTGSVFALGLGMVLLNSFRVQPSDIASHPTNTYRSPSGSFNVKPFSSSPSTTDAAIETPPPSPTTEAREQWLDALYQDPSVSTRLKAARDLAAEGTETAFVDLATFIAAAEEEGGEGLLSLAAQVASVLSQMRGDALSGIATELAYDTSPLVAEAAVDAAVRREIGDEPVELSASALPNPGDQQALDEYAERLHAIETAPYTPTPERQ